MGIELELSRAHANCDYLNTFTSTRNAKYSGYVVSKVFVPAEGGYFFVENEIIQQIIFTATITRNDNLFCGSSVIAAVVKTKRFRLLLYIIHTLKDKWTFICNKWRVCDIIKKNYRFSDSLCDS